MKNILLLSFLFCLLSCNVPFIGDAAANDKRLQKMETDFTSLRHPAASKELSFRSTIGVFGNGNHCDFFCGAIRSYSGSKEDILAFYKQEAAKNPGIQEPEISWIDNASSYFLCCYYSKLSDWDISETPDSNMYLVSFYINSEANNDTRCH